MDNTNSIDGQLSQARDEEDVADSLAAVDATFSRPDAYGVVMIDGYGCSLSVQRGHLTATDGIGPYRRNRRWPRAGHGLTRVVITGRARISTEALKWCRHTGINILVLDPWKLQPLMVSANEPVRDGRLRRAQAIAGVSSAGLELARELIVAKVTGQADVARSHLAAPELADHLAGLAEQAGAAKRVEQVRRAEAQAAGVYWQAWKGVTASFAARDRVALPEHWQTMGARRSLINPTGARYATNPVNAILNLLYRLVEVEARFACLAMGLDPLLGVIHVDERDRDSLPLDLMEPVRPVVDGWVLAMLSLQVFRKNDFHERADGFVSIVPPLSHSLAETMPQWAEAIGPWTERAAAIFASVSPYKVPIPTRLTQRNRVTRARKPRPTQSGLDVRVARACAECGTPTQGRRKLCDGCLAEAKIRSSAAAAARSQAARERRRAAGEAQPTWAPSVNGARAERMRQQKAERDAWEAAHQGEAWDSAAFEPIRKALAEVPMSAVMQATGMSRGACAAIRSGRQPCHPRHWEVLARLAGMSLPERPSQSKRATDLVNGADE
jgi:CRISPR-associated endonuclease Cas1